ncbi:MAG: hypothetical protein ACJATI_005617, partial [Halioglobus sp.]
MKNKIFFISILAAAFLGIYTFGTRSFDNDQTTISVDTASVVSPCNLLDLEKDISENPEIENAEVALLDLNVDEKVKEVQNVIVAPEGIVLSKSSNISGSIGINLNDKIDSPTDNVFKINLKQNINQRHAYILKYQVKGVEGSESTRKSINENSVYGGYLVKSNNKWTEVEELLDARQLKKGVNTIRFDGSLEKTGYEVKEVNITTLKYKFGKEQLVFNPATIALIKDNESYLSGFTYNDKISMVHIGNESYPIIEGR